MSARASSEWPNEAFGAVADAFAAPATRSVAVPDDPIGEQMEELILDAIASAPARKHFPVTLG
jgi:hypothetical protein